MSQNRTSQSKAPEKYRRSKTKIRFKTWLKLFESWCNGKVFEKPAPDETKLNELPGLLGDDELKSLEGVRIELGDNDDVCSYRRVIERLTDLFEPKADRVSALDQLKHRKWNFEDPNREDLTNYIASILDLCEIAYPEMKRGSKELLDQIKDCFCNGLPEEL